MQDSKQRSFVKGISWRVLASLTTLVIAFFISSNENTHNTQQTEKALFLMSLTEFVGKFALYYFYERLWNFIPFGRTSKGPSYLRTAIKGVLWRTTATSVIILLYFLFIHNIDGALKLGVYDFVIKLLVYYIHERLWGEIRWGRIRGNVNPTLSNKNLIMDLDIDKINHIAIKAGQKIMDIYENEDFEKTIDFKSDDSPLTIADKASHEIIVEELEKLNLGIPILSEEGEEIPYERRKKWTYYWCIDSLDGTKEFIKKNGEFTVNIALIYKNKSILGVIYAPVLNTLYFGKENKGAFKKTNENIEQINCSFGKKNRIAVRSKSHASKEEETILAKYEATESISVGSSLKFCMIAEGKANVYYRFGPTMEWDTAAGQAIVEASGGTVLNQESQPFSYNKENLLNGSFLCLGK